MSPGRAEACFRPSRGYGLTLSSLRCREGNNKLLGDKIHIFDQAGLRGIDAGKVKAACQVRVSLPSAHGPAQPVGRHFECRLTRMDA